MGAVEVFRSRTASRIDTSLCVRKRTNDLKTHVFLDKPPRSPEIQSGNTTKNLQLLAHLVGVLGHHLVVRVGDVRAPHYERLVVEDGGGHDLLFYFFWEKNNS